MRGVDDASEGGCSVDHASEFQQVPVVEVIQQQSTDEVLKTKFKPDMRGSQRARFRVDTRERIVIHKTQEWTTTASLQKKRGSEK